jgi:hypothetical protein
MKVKTRIGPGSGPHAGRLEFKYQGKWHFLRWASKKEMLMPHTTYIKIKALKKDLCTTSSSNKT